jgi:hypothetical protein
MQLRRPLALMTGALVLSLGGLTSCGFDLATDRPYTPGKGTNAREGQVKLLSAVVAAAQPNQGTFIVTVVNNSEADATLSGLSGANVDVADFEPIEVAPGEAVNLAEAGGVTISGDFDAGAVLPLTVTFGDSSTTELSVPVVPACDEYEGLDLSEASENIPYDCDFEAPPAGGEGH